MRKRSVQKAAMASVGIVLLAGGPAALAAAGANPAGHVGTRAARMIKTRLSRAGSSHPVRTPFTSSASARVIAVNCDGHAQVSPKRLALRCATRNRPPGNYLTGLSWQQWGWHDSAYGIGTEHPATCVGSTSVAVVLWRPQSWPGHARQRYFSRITVINEGAPAAWSPRTSTVHLLP
jgi:hypothetical protein